MTDGLGWVSAALLAIVLLLGVRVRHLQRLLAVAGQQHADELKKLRAELSKQSVAHEIRKHLLESRNENLRTECNAMRALVEQLKHRLSTDQLYNEMRDQIHRLRGT